MKHLFYIIIAFAVLSCSSNTPEEQAAKAARSYYARLLDDRPAAFLDGKANADSLPDAYREQLIEACVQYMADMVSKHGGLADVAVSPNVGRRDTSLHVTYAFLLLSYADSTQEEIAVPMVETADGRWLMR